MDACAQAQPGCMAAVLRLTASQVEETCAQIEGAWPVNYNAPGQTVVAMRQEAQEALTQKVAALRGRVVPLNVSGGFHSPLMDGAAEGLKRYLESIILTQPTKPLYANLTARPYEASSLADTLAQQAHRPVRWQQSVENMLADGVNAFVRWGPARPSRG